MIFMPIAVFFQMATMPLQVMQPVLVPVVVPAIVPATPVYSHPDPLSNEGKQTRTIYAKQKNKKIPKTVQVAKNDTVKPSAVDSFSLSDLIPTVKRYPRAQDKDLLVVSVKCPTENLGIKTPATTIFHSIIDSGISCINQTNIAPVELQQVCV